MRGKSIISPGKGDLIMLWGEGRAFFNAKRASDTIKITEESTLIFAPQMSYVKEGKEIFGKGEILSFYKGTIEP